MRLLLAALLVAVVFLIPLSATAQTNTFYLDSDADGWGSDFDTLEIPFEDPPPSGYVLQGGDCDDSNNTVYPGALEVCDGFDNDCNGIVDDGPDLDGDGFTECDGDSSGPIRDWMKCLLFLLHEGAVTDRILAFGSDVPSESIGHHSLDNHGLSVALRCQLDFSRAHHD